MYKSIDKRESTGAISIHGPVSVAFSTFNLVATIYHPEITPLLLFVTPRSTESPRFAPRILLFVNHVLPILRARCIRPSANRPISLYIQLHLRPNVCILCTFVWSNYFSANTFSKSRSARIYYSDSFTSERSFKLSIVGIHFSGLFANELKRAEIKASFTENKHIRRIKYDVSTQHRVRNTFFGSQERSIISFHLSKSFKILQDIRRCSL